MTKIAVIGSGTMGNGISHTFAQYGYSVNLIDINAAALEKAIANITKNLDRQLLKELLTEQDKKETLSRIHTFTDLADGVSGADVVIEAATEDEGLKLKIFRELTELVSGEAILATNTSSISITKIAGVTKNPENVIGMHFMNPVPVMRLVEVINGYSTAKSTTNRVLKLAETVGKIPIIANDYPGFVANRILIPMINEAIHSLFEGVAGVSEIDTVMKLGMAHPMGPLQLADFIGLDVCLAILNVLYDGFKNPKYAPCPLLVNMVTAGQLGIKSGSGFYDYSNGVKDLKVAAKFT